MDDPARWGLAEAAGVMGWPALSLPAGLTGDGLPVGLELCSTPGSDQRLLSRQGVRGTVGTAAGARTASCQPLPRT